MSPQNDSFCIAVNNNEIAQDIWGLHDEFSIHGKVVATFLLSFILLGLPWNILVLITIVTKKLYHQPTIIVLLVLVVADIFILVVSAPILMATGFTGEFGKGLSDQQKCEVCRVEFAFTSMIPMYGSFFAIAVMAVDRFIYIYKPLQYDRLAKPHIMWAAILVLAVLTIAIGLALLFTPGSLSFYPPIMSCAVDIRPVLAALAVLSSAGLIVIIACNIGFSYIVLKNIHAVYKNKGYLVDKDLKRSQRLTRHRKEGRLYLMFFVLLLTCAVSWVPILIVLVGYTITDNFNIFPLPYVSLSLILFYSQAIIDPFVETMLIMDVRKPLMNMVTCGLLKRAVDKSIHKEEGKKKEVIKEVERNNLGGLLLLFQAAVMHQENHAPNNIVI